MIKVSVSPPQLVQGRVTELDVVLTNTAPGTCSNIIFKLSLPPEIRLLRGDERILLPRMAAGERVSRRVQVRADAVGRWRIDTANFSYRDPRDIPVRVPRVDIEVAVGPAMPSAEPPEQEPLVQPGREESRAREPPPGRHGNGTPRALPAKILYLAANPTDTLPLRLAQEVRDISDVLKRGQFRDRFELIPSFAVRVRDISQDVMDHSPRIIHFAGHGETDGGLYAEDDSGSSYHVDRDTMVALVRLAEEVTCVVINACNTERLANALAVHVDYVIGMRYRVSDKAAIGFSVGFYQAIAADRPVEAAFNAGRALLRAHSQNMRETQSPFLLMRGQSLAAAPE